MNKLNKNNPLATVLKSALLFTVLSLASGCSGGAGSIDGQTPTQLTGNTTTTTVAQSNLKMALCNEVNSWGNNCRFLGMKYLELNPEEVTPLTEAFGRGRGRGGRTI